MTQLFVRRALAGGFLAALLVLALCACKSGDDKVKPEHPSCKQAADCGEGGRLYFVCSPEGLCYTVKDYCAADSECIGSCKEHVCTEGKKPVVLDGDSETENEFDGECPYDCCQDTDCRQGATCNPSTHICVISSTCYDECCRDQDCVDNIKFGADYGCVKKHCKKPSDPCATACCANADCKAGEACNDNGVCYKISVSCTPGYSKCCAADPEASDCKALGALSSEAKLVCNSSGNAWVLDKCPANNDCQDGGNGSVSCFANGRCEMDSDCACPKICLASDDGTSRCQLTPAKEGDTCMSDLCTTGLIQTVACPQGTTCCDLASPAVCKKTAECVAPPAR